MNKPVVPEVPLALWRELYAAAHAYHELCPWEWMPDIFWLGVQTQGLARVLCVLGQNREVFGLAGYRGAGINHLLRLRIGEVEPEDESNLHKQDAIFLDFEAKSRFHQNDKQLLKRLDYRPPRVQPRGYPYFRSHRPWYAPWFIEEAEAQIMLHDLRCMAEFARLIRDHPEFFDDRGPLEVPFLLTPFRDKLSLDQLDWQQMLIPRTSEVPTLPPEKKLASLRRLPVQSRFHLELDAFPTLISIGEGPRPWSAKMALAVDGDSGMVLNHTLGKPEVTLGDTAVKCLVDLIQQARCRPGQLQVYPDHAESLAPLANALQLTLQVVEYLPMVEEARSSLMQRFGG